MYRLTPVGPVPAALFWPVSFIVFLSFWPFLGVLGRLSGLDGFGPVFRLSALPGASGGLIFNGSFRVRFGFRVPSCFVFGVLRIARTLGQGFLFGSGLAFRASWPLLMVRFVFFRGSSFGAVPRFWALFLVGLLAEPRSAFWLFRLG